MELGSARGYIKTGEIHAVVTRADGTVEVLGLVDYYSSNPFKLLLFRARRWLAARRTRGA